MPHLIQPLEIDGSTYCVDQFGNRGTRGVATALIITPTDPPDVSIPSGAWTVAVNGVATESEISFGVGCGDTVNLDLDVFGSSTDYLVEVGIYINGIGPAYTETFTFGGATSASVAIALTDLVCGNIVTLVVNIQIADDPEFCILAAQVTSITA